MAQSVLEFSPKDDDDLQETSFVNRGCFSCLNFPCCNSKQSDWERISVLEGDLQESNNNRSLWDKGVNALKKVREWSELVAGPKWKTFIRRFNKNGGRQKSGKFQYDPMSYALNFDEGPGKNGQLDDDRFFRDFSSRFAAIPRQNDQSKDAPVVRLS